LRFLPESQDSSTSYPLHPDKKAPRQTAGEPFRNSISNSLLLLLLRLGSFSLLGWLLGSTWLAGTATFSCQFAHLPQRQSWLRAYVRSAKQPLAARFCADYRDSSRILSRRISTSRENSRLSRDWCSYVVTPGQSARRFSLARCNKECYIHVKKTKPEKEEL
jgi:hypothetical protein